jgi:hypothetical protein
MDHHDIYISTEKGLTKAGECDGTRATQVKLRREIRAKLGVERSRIVLYTNGILRKVGID